MRLYVELGGRGRIVALAIDDDAATVGELSVALGVPEPRSLRIDGRIVDPDHLLIEAGLVDGARIDLNQGDLSESEDSEHARLGESWLGVVGGPDSGVIHRLSSPTTIRIGRNPENDLTIANDSVSGVHGELQWGDHEALLTDLGSHNGSWLAGVAINGSQPVDEAQPIRLGSSQLRLRRVDTGDRPLGSSVEHATSAGRILLNRPPRAAIPPEPTPLLLPDPIKDRENPRLSIVSLIVPVLFAVVMVTVTRDPRFGLFALMSPLMAIGNYVSNRRKVKSERLSDASTHADALERLQRELVRGVQQERARRLHLGPDLLELRRRIEVPSSRLWERRLTSEDALVARIGSGDVPWSPPIDKAGPALEEIADDVQVVLDEFTAIDDVELLADLREGVLGIHGDRDRSRAAIRALTLQLATAHGPSDLRIAVLTDEESRREWSWIEWLPHATVSDGSGALVLTAEGARRFGEKLAEELPEPQTNRPASFAPRWLLIVDDVGLVHERASAVRRLLENTDLGIHGVVRADRVDQLPASTTQVLEVEGVDGACKLGRVDDRSAHGAGSIDDLSASTAAEIAQAMARFEDPEQELIGGELPERLSIRDVLVPPDAESIKKRWDESAKQDAVLAPLGVGSEGAVVIDMVVDGPHGLVAGTTGAGKSELLRTMVVGGAAEHSPDDLVFVLIDYKGGSAFDRCSSLPHVVGMVTDLDEHLSQRALRSLDAELHHRELVLRDAGYKDIPDYRAAGSPSGPLPRLVVVVDEFATLRAELPDFVSALVGIAQRGRSLGVHLILATQRPSGAVDANIRANTNLRIALRVQDAGDSKDVIDTAVAAELPRTLPGRAFVRRGEGDLTPVQTAYASGPVPTSSGPLVRVTEIGGAPRPASKGSDISELTNLGVYVDACIEAGGDYAPARRPWTDPLPDSITATELSEIENLAKLGDDPITLGVGDDPDHQRRVQVGWDPLAGHLGAIGALGGGVSTLLRSAAIAVGNGELGRDVWVYGADHGAQGLAGLDAYPHVAPIIDADDSARHERLLTMLERTLDERSQDREAASAAPLLVIVIDGIAGFAERNDLGGGTVAGDRFGRIVRDGPAVGIVFVVGATSYKDLPRSLRGAFRTTFVFEQNDTNDYSSFGLRPKEIPTFRPGRAVIGDAKTLVQVIDWSISLLPEAISVSAPPTSVEPLPASVDRDTLPPATIGATLEIPIGLDNVTREPAVAIVRAGEHLAIAGPAASGKSTTLRTIAEQLRAGDPEIALVGIAPVESALFESGVFDAGGTYDDVRSVLEIAETDHRRWVVIVDDAERIEDESGPLHTFARGGPSHITLVVSLRASSARQAFGHWARFVRASGVGVLLQPDNTADGDVLGVRLPRGERLENLPGRGYLVQAGAVAECQIAR